MSSPAPHPLLDPAVTAAVERAARAHLGHPWRSQHFTSLDERSSHPCGILDGERLSIFAKLGSSPDQFAAELAGLRLLSQRAGIRTPNPVATGLVDLPPGRVLLLFEALPERPPDARQRADWASIGQVLATVHQATSPQFGLDQDNFFGPLPQDNRPAPTWSAFFRDRRLLPLLEAATASGHLPADLAIGLARIAGRLPGLCGPDPYPTLMHGDAQHHNFISTPAGAVVIDACPYFGHPEIDLAQLGFFHPVPAGVFAAYRDITRIDPGYPDREELWRLPTYLAIVAVAPAPGPYLTRLTRAVRRYA